VNDRHTPARPDWESAGSHLITAVQDLRALYVQQLSERGFRSDPAQLAAVEKLERLRRRLIANHRTQSSLLGRLLRGAGRRSPEEPSRGLYLWGPAGRGKTWLMDLFFESLPFPERRRRHFHRFMYDVRTELRRLQQEESPLEHVAEAIGRETRVLCFDELFVTDIADAMILGGLFSGLFRRGVTLVATSNVRPAELYRDGLQRQRFVPAIELIEQHVEVLAVDGPTDYRLRRLTQAGTYLMCGASDTAARLEALFVELAGHGHIASGSIEIEGRLIPVIRRGQGAVWFDFAALCAGPRSQDDYIQIAREYQSVLLSDVPVLDELHDNEARRFIALVDELYDRNVNLVLSAAALPAQLYRGERLKDQFERTASRLVEMQSKDYLAREHRP
jgi:cell division protein ZapE